jgi:hypothetical protein
VINDTDRSDGRTEARTARAHVRPGDTPRRTLGADPHAMDRAFGGLVGAAVLSQMTEAAPRTTARPDRRHRLATHRRRTA